VLPAPAASDEAAVYLLAGRVGGWRGIFAHHSWIVLKEKGADRYRRFDVVGWGSPLRRDGYDADGRWYGNTPEILGKLEGAAAERAIGPLLAAIDGYPHAGRGAYRIWPGPNSNSFVAEVVRAAPALAPALLPTALGKDYRADGRLLGLTPSGTGIQVTLMGVAGVSLGWVEGVEVNLFGLVAGADLRRPALKLPGWGRIGLAPG